MTESVDDVTIEFCLSCANHLALEEGWAGYCPSCLMLSDEHLAGLHDGQVVPECRNCLGADDEPLRATA